MRSSISGSCRGAWFSCRIPPVSGGGCSTMLGASVHTALLMQGCHRRPVSVFGGIFVTVAQRVQNAVSVPVVIAGDANVWHPHFNHPDHAMCQSSLFWDLLMVSCRLELCSPPDRATHISGAGSDCIFISSGHVVDVVVHDGLQCCTGSPVCCPVLGSDHFLCAAGLSLPTRPDPVRGPTLPPLRDWRPILIRAHAELLQWSARVHDLSASPVHPPEDSLDGVLNEMIAILHHHAPAQRRRQPSWWTPVCHQACVARNGAWRDHRRAPSAANTGRFHNARIFPSCCAQVSESVLVGLAREHDISVAREPPSCRLPESDRCSVVSQDVTTRIWSCGHSSHPQNLPGQTLWSSGGNISFQFGHNLLVHSTRTSMTKSRGDSPHCSLVRMTQEANLMVHS